MLISGLALNLFQGKALTDYDFENERYIFLPYHKVTAENVDEFLSKGYQDMLTRQQRGIQKGNEAGNGIKNKIGFGCQNMLI